MPFNRWLVVHEVGVTNDVPTSSCFELGLFKRFRQVMGSRDSELPDRANFAARLSLLVTLSVDSRVPSHPGSDSMSQSFLKCASPNQSSSLQLVQSLVPVLSWGCAHPSDVWFRVRDQPVSKSPISFPRLVSIE
jgi:hypothetical protein